MTGAAPYPFDRGVVDSAPAGVDAPPRARPWILAATILGSGMVFIDGTVVNIAVPRIQIQFNTSAADVQWVVEAYALFLSALLLVGGAMGDRYGRRRIFAVGVALFAAASLWCGLASEFTELVIARALQGIGAALLVPGSLAILSASFPESERGRAIGTWSGFTGITTALGPVLGGWLIDHASWRWAFLLNLPLAGLVLWLARTHVPETRNPAQLGRLDWAGAALATLALGLVVYALLESSNRGLGDAFVLSALAAGIGCTFAFWFVEKHASAPMLPLTLFRSRDFSGANLLTLLLYAPLGGGVVLPAAQPDSGTALLHDCGWRGAATVHRDHVCALTLGRRLDSAHRRQVASHCRSCHCGVRVRVAGVARDRRRILGDFLPGHLCPGPGHGGQRGAPHDHRDGLSPA